MLPMNREEIEETRAFWNRVAEDWEIQVGDEGDSNRRLNSDPILWKFTGDVAGLTVLDAGCGTGYLSRKLLERGAKVRGVDISEKMIELARAKAPLIDFQVDSCSELKSVADESIDLVIANYVLMDVSDLPGTMSAFYRVLKSDGIAVLIFSHPCFPAELATSPTEGVAVVDYRWNFPYFQQKKCVAPPWAHFTTEFIWFHRPLSDYWKAFKSAGFALADLEEPRITEDRYHLIADAGKLHRSQSRPFSIAFKLRKSG